MAELVNTRDLMDTLAVRKLCGRWLGHRNRSGHFQPVTRHTLLRWRELHGFPQPLDTPHVSTCELWDRRAVRAWIKEWTER